MVMLCMPRKMSHPTRKLYRLKGHNYNSPGAYFITICTANRCPLFWRDVGASIARPEDVPLSMYGTIVDTAIRMIPQVYPAISVDRYVIMPDHIHLLLQIHTSADGRPMVAPTIDMVVRQLKGYVTKQIKRPIWQKLYYDHVVRGIQDYNDIWTYIENNPSKRCSNTV